MTKAELVALLTEIERQLSGSIESAKSSAEKYASETGDRNSKWPFEVGHLSGTIKSSLILINEWKKMKNLL